MSNYALVERRLGKIRVTDTGKRIVFPMDSKEKAEAVKAALLKVALWSRLYQDYTAKGADLPSNFWADLAKIANIPPDDAKSKADIVIKAYNDDIAYLKSVEKEVSMIGGSQSGQNMRPNPQSGTGMGRQVSDDADAGDQVITAKAGKYESGKIYFISPDDKVDQVAPRSAWQIDLLKTYINGVLDHMKDQLVSEAQMVTDREKAKKSGQKADT